MAILDQDCRQLEDDLVSAKLLLWSLQTGEQTPHRERRGSSPDEEAVHAFLEKFGHHIICLTGTNDWRERYGDDTSIAQEFGMYYAHHSTAVDPKLLSSPSQENGMTILTDFPMIKKMTIELGTARAMKTTLDIGRCGLQIVMVILNQSSPDESERQLRKACLKLKPDRPAILAGKFPELHSPTSAMVASLNPFESQSNQEQCHHHLASNYLTNANGTSQRTTSKTYILADSSYVFSNGHVHTGRPRFINDTPSAHAGLDVEIEII